jgi:putative peptidoglycan lipid II flippase
MAPLLALFALGMPFFAVTSLMTRAFYATKDTSTPVKIATLSFLVNIGLGWWLKDIWGARGLVVASTTAVVVQTVALQHLLGVSLPGMVFGDLWGTLGKILIGTLAMGSAVGGGWWLIRGIYGADMLAVFGLIPFGVAVYAGVLWGLRIEGREELAAIVAKFRRKRA